MTPDNLALRFFENSIESIVNHTDSLIAPLVAASELLTRCLLNEGRLLVCGNGASALNAQFLSTILMNQGERERPGLPALLLDNHSATITGVEQDYGLNDVFARQVRALGRKGDLLIAFTRTGNPPNLVNAVSAAHEREMNVIAISGSGEGNIASLLYNGDIEICAPSSSRFHVYQIHLMIAFALCELIEQQLFGEG